MRERKRACQEVDSFCWAPSGKGEQDKQKRCSCPLLTYTHTNPFGLSGILAYQFPARYKPKDEKTHNSRSDREINEKCGFSGDNGRPKAMMTGCSPSPQTFSDSNLVKLCSKLENGEIQLMVTDKRRCKNKTSMKQFYSCCRKYGGEKKRIVWTWKCLQDKWWNGEEVKITCLTESWNEYPMKHLRALKL